MRTKTLGILKRCFSHEEWAFLEDTKFFERHSAKNFDKAERLVSIAHALLIESHKESERYWLNTQYSFERRTKPELGSDAGDGGGLGSAAVLRTDFSEQTDK